jgi:hypothetical protein
MIVHAQAVPEAVRERVVRMVADHRGDYESEYAAIRSIVAKLGIATPETLRAQRSARPRSIRGNGDGSDVNPVRDGSLVIQRVIRNYSANSEKSYSVR